MQASLIVAAGGLGSRFLESSQNPLLKKSPSKLFFPLQGKPVLSHCLETFQACPQISETILAVPAGTEKQILALAKRSGWRKVKVLSGGKTRAESVLKALKRANRKSDWVMVHDGARPFVSKEMLDQLFRAASSADGVIAAKKVVPTIKQADPNRQIVRTLDRSSLYEAETPQLVKKRLLQKAFDTLTDALNATDEASMLEALSAKVKLVTHDTWNPKITSYKDWELAEAYLGTVPALRGLSLETRVGFGRDIHRLVEGRKFILGGVRIPFPKGPLGHSDGDALLHALSDAILGAAGLGDIGEWFSDRDPKHKNIASGKILQTIMEAVKKKGWRIVNADTVVILEKPKLSPYKAKIRETVSKLLGIEPDRVSIKAKTMEGFGPEGQGLAISCEALVTLKKLSNQ